MLKLNKKLVSEVREAKEKIKATLFASNSNEVAENNKGLRIKKSQLAYCLAVAEQFLEAELQIGEALTCPTKAETFLKSCMADLPHEVFAILLLDTQKQVIHYEELFRGTVDSAAVYPREIVKLVLEHNASAVILAHNHPSGKTDQSQSDVEVTKRISKALETIEVRVVDHLIVGRGKTLSFAEKGLL